MVVEVCNIFIFLYLIFDSLVAPAVAIAGVMRTTMDADIANALASASATFIVRTFGGYLTRP